MKTISIVPHFWKWFKLHNSMYLRIMEPGSRVAFTYQFNELQVHVRAYCKWLSADLIIHEGRVGGTLIITANGNENGFKKADRMIAKAPDIPHWTFFALRPPCGGVDTFAHPVCQEVDITPGNCWFRLSGKFSFGQLAIEIYVDWILPGKENDVYLYVELLVEHLLGERSATEDIDIESIKPMCDAPRNAKLRKLEDLPGVVDKDKSFVKVGPGGRMEGLG